MIRTRDINVPVMAGMTSSCLFSEIKGVNYPFSDLDLRLIIKFTALFVSVGMMVLLDAVSVSERFSKPILFTSVGSD